MMLLLRVLRRRALLRLKAAVLELKEVDDIVLPPPPQQLLTCVCVCVLGPKPRQEPRVPNFKCSPHNVSSLSALLQLYLSIGVNRDLHMQFCSVSIAIVLRLCVEEDK